MDINTKDQIELAVRRARGRMLQEFPQNPDVLKMLDYLVEEIHDVDRPVPEGLPHDPYFAAPGSQ